MFTSIYENLEKLTSACGISGREEEVRISLGALMKPYVDEIQVDKLGNLIGLRWGKEGAPKIMLAAHMDEVGLMVKTISKEGFVHFLKIGGIDDRNLICQRVTIHTSKGALPGIIVSRLTGLPSGLQKDEERKRVLSTEELLIDIGVKSREDADSTGLRVGDIISFDSKLSKIGDCVVGRALDNRVGCTVMLETLRNLVPTDCTIYAVGTVQEEVGLRGAGTAAFRLNPDVALALDITIAGDVPGVKEYDSSLKLGKGPALTVFDPGLLAHPKLLSLLIETAEENGIAYQLEASTLGSTDATRTALTREGIPSASILVPLRYIHTAISMINVKDVESCAKLAALAIQKIQGRF